MLELLKTVYSGELLPLTLAVAGLSVAVGVATVWAVCSRRHWFLRTTVVGAIISAALLIPGYDLVLICFVEAVAGASLLTCLKLLTLRKAKRLRQQDGQEPVPERASLQFTLADLLLAVLVLSAVLGVASCVPKSVWAEWKLIGMFGLGFAVFAGQGLNTTFVLSGRERLGSMPAGKLHGAKWRRTLIVLAVLNLLVFCVVLLVLWPQVAVFHVAIHPTPLPPITLPDPNGYDDLVRAGAELGAIGVPDIEKASAAELGRFIAVSGEALEAARRGLDRECQVPLTYTEADNNRSDHDFLHELSRTFLAEGKLADLEGRTSDAVGSYLDILRLADAVPRGGNAMDALVGWAAADRALKALASIRQGMDCDQCRRTIEALARFDAHREPMEEIAAREALWSEHASGKAGRACRVVGLFTLREDIRGVLTRCLKRNQARTRLLMCELALCQYRLEHGSEAKGLAGLVPECLPAVPIDPYGGGPLVHRPTSSGYELYSVGPDGVDDDGRPMQEKDTSEIWPGDLHLYEPALDGPVEQ